MKKLCPHCEKETEIKLVKAKEHIIVRGESIEVPVEYSQCIECKGSFENTRGLDSLDLAYKEYRRLYEMLHPEDIKELGQILDKLKTNKL